MTLTNDTIHDYSAELIRIQASDTPGDLSTRERVPPSRHHHTRPREKPIMKHTYIGQSFIKIQVRNKEDD